MMKSRFSLITSQEDPSDVQLSELMTQVRRIAHSRVKRVDSQLSDALVRAITAKKKNTAVRAIRNV